VPRPSAYCLLQLPPRPAARYVNGTHYSKTLEAWLVRHDRHKADILKAFQGTYGAQSSIYFHRWRVFYLSCSELFNYNKGEEWGVGHYLFQKA
jgi:cyclopropane-fatty-acyl-phospholipid synthase